jgi:predicted  nucleic acid-binding Zn-ribbon protein
MSEDEAKTLKESGALYDEFSDRNLECCTNCGSKNRFLNVSEDYVDECLHGDKIPPILLKHDEPEPKRNTEAAKTV